MTYAILFPGQGSQRVGIGLDLYENSFFGKELFIKVDSMSGRNISKIIFKGPEAELNQTKNTQVSISIISVILSHLLKEELLKRNLVLEPSGCAGHSLGEFTALWYGDILSLDDLIKLVLERGELMQTATSGGMAAILNAEKEKIEELLNKDEYKDNLIIANYNSPFQHVISGKKELIEKFTSDIKLINGKSIILPVSGAFHSSLMKEPAKIFSLEIEKLLNLPSKNAKRPIYQNSDGLPSQDYKTILGKLQKQMTSPVLWTQIINNLVKDGVKAFIEIGPGKVLTGLVKKINPNTECYNIFDLVSLKEFCEIYAGKLPQTKAFKTS